MHPTETMQHMQQARYPSRALAPVVPLRPGQALAPHGGAIEGEVVEYTEERRHGDELVAVARAAGVASRWSWRNRWGLSPAAAGLLTMGTAAAGNAATGAAWWATITAGVAWWALKGPERIAGRTWLSRRERKVGAAFGAGAAAWSSLAALGAIEPASGMGWATLAAATGVQGLMWAASRTTRPAPVDAEVIEDETSDIDPALAQLIEHLIECWPYWSQIGPREIAGTVLDDVHSPRSGTVTAKVLLPADMHPAKVARAAQAIVEHVEAQLGLGMGIADITTDRDDVTCVRLTISPTRDLESKTVRWSGPDLDRDGTVTLATLADGTTIRIPLWGGTGARNMLIAGGAGAGKTSVVPMLLIPAALSGHMVIWHIDGKEGASVPHLAGLFDWVANDKNSWSNMIKALHAVLESRRRRYGRFGFATFQHQHDPLLTLFIDEAHKLSDALAYPDKKLLVEIAAQGRQLGIALWISTQSVNADDIPGGMPLRNNIMANGTTVGMKPGGAVASCIMTTNASERIDLTALPGNGGWCAVLNKGDVLSAKCRTFFLDCDKGEEKPWMEQIAQVGVTHLSAEDQAAAAAVNPGAWNGRMTGPAWAQAQADAREAAAAAGVDMAAEPLIDENGRWVHVDLPTTAAPAPASSQASAPAGQAQAQPLRLVDDAPADDDDDTESVPSSSPASPALHQFQQMQAQMADAALPHVLHELRTAGPLTKAQLMERLSLSEATARRRLHKLRESGLARVDDQYRWSAAA